MGNSDRSLRGSALPYIGQIFGYNRNEQSDQDASNATALGDLKYLANDTAHGFAPAQDNMIRILRPQFAQIIAAHLSISLITATAETNPYFKISIWKVTSATDLTALTPSEATISAHMKALTGADTPFTNTAGQAINVDALNIKSLIPQSTDANYNADCFTIGVHFYTSTGLRATPSGGAGYKLRRFVVDMSAQVAP